MPSDDYVFSEPREALRAWIPPSHGGERAERWPLPVELPLVHLDGALANGMPGLAYVKVREAAEGVVRTAWTFLVHEVLEWVPRAQDVAALPDDQRALVERLLSAVATRSFSFGGACYVVARQPGKVVRGLADALRERDSASVTAAWNDTLSGSSAVRRVFDELPGDQGAGPASLAGSPAASMKASAKTTAVGMPR